MVDASLQFFAFRLSFSSSPSAIVLVSPLHSILFFSVHTCSLLFASLRSLTNTQTTTRKLVCSGHNSIHKLHRTAFFLLWNMCTHSAIIVYENWEHFSEFFSSILYPKFKCMIQTYVLNHFSMHLNGENYTHRPYFSTCDRIEIRHCGVLAMNRANKMRFKTESLKLQIDLTV